MALLGRQLAGKAVIYSTTNGTVALNKSRDARTCSPPRCSNGEAVSDRIERTVSERDVLLRVPRGLWGWRTNSTWSDF